ncbi:hypothetical protein HU200_037052 [Digitaria exilis]|uniref:Uncharacterized protein n=1 Tax=Digitaria exilis TaxID=1010633 RepID=A0A835EN48_9POAL|nr:hypothetical protein HU200_037052 [Digitaria exilis]
MCSARGRVASELNASLYRLGNWEERGSGNAGPKLCPFSPTSAASPTPCMPDTRLHPNFSLTAPVPGTCDLRVQRHKGEDPCRGDEEVEERNPTDTGRRKGQLLPSMEGAAPIMCTHLEARAPHRRVGLSICVRRASSLVVPFFFLPKEGHLEIACHGQRVSSQRGTQGLPMRDTYPPTLCLAAPAYKMLPNPKQLEQYYAGETKARAEVIDELHFSEKTGHVLGVAQEKGREAKDKASGAADHAMGRSQDAMGATRDKAREAADRTMGMGRDAKETTRDKAYQAKDAASDAAGRAMDKGRGAAEATRDKAYQAKDKASDTASDGAQQTGSYLSQTAEVAKQKAAGAAQYAKETVVAGKDKTGAILQQAGETVMSTAVGAKDKVVSTAVGAKDAVVNSLGMAGENKDGTTNAGKDTSTYKPGRDY